MEQTQNLYLALGLYNQAVEQLTNQVQNTKTYENLLQRSVAYEKLNKLEESLKDCLEAQQMNNNRFEAFLHEGIIYFKQGNFQKSVETLVTAIQLNSQASEVAETYIKKCEAELKNKQLSKKPQSEQISSQPMKKGKIAYTWYQTNYVVGVELNQPVQTKEQIKHLFNSNSCEVILKIDNETEVQLNLDLFDEIDVEKSTVNFNLQKVELKLVKKVPNKNWPHLEAIEKIVQNQNQPLSVEEKQTFNASSAKVKRDWNKIDKDLEKEIEEDLKTDPLQHLFKQIYGNADEQTKKAMIKSFQTSGGTVLSTNWDEVSKKDYEGKDRPEAPKGQQWNKSEM